MCGLSVLVTVSFEMPLFAYSRDLVTRFSPRDMLAMAACSYAVRVFGYTIFESSWPVLSVEWLHGVTYGLGALGSVHYSQRIGGEKLAATAQALTDNVKSLGGVLATLSGGVIMQLWGARGLYASAASALVVALGLFLWATRSHTSRARQVCQAPETSAPAQDEIAAAEARDTRAAAELGGEPSVALECGTSPEEGAPGA